MIIFLNVLLVALLAAKIMSCHTNRTPEKPLSLRRNLTYPYYYELLRDFNHKSMIKPGQSEKLRIRESVSLVTIELYYIVD